MSGGTKTKSSEKTIRMQRSGGRPKKKKGGGRVCVPYKKIKGETKGSKKNRGVGHPYNRIKGKKKKSRLVLECRRRCT